MIADHAKSARHANHNGARPRSSPIRLRMVMHCKINIAAASMGGATENKLACQAGSDGALAQAIPARMKQKMAQN